MITAVDTNILLDILRPNPSFADASAEALEEAAQNGTAVICDLVYAELCSHFSKQEECEEFLAASQIRVEALRRESHFLASRVWREYRTQGGTKSRILVDFLIGAHAKVQAGRLLSRDRGFYRKSFPSLVVVGPSAD